MQRTAASSSTQTDLSQPGGSSEEWLFMNQEKAKVFIASPPDDMSAGRMCLHKTCQPSSSKTEPAREVSESRFTAGRSVIRNNKSSSQVQLNPGKHHLLSMSHLP